jgi:hypothetical protein
MAVIFLIPVGAKLSPLSILIKIGTVNFFVQSYYKLIRTRFLWQEVYKWVNGPGMTN